MDYKRVVIGDGVGLNIVKCEKFKSGFFSINFIAPLNREENTKNALLMQVLRRGGKLYPSQQIINRELAKNYGQTLDAFVRKRGEVQIFGVDSTVLNNEFAYGEGDIFRQGIDIVSSLIFEPLVSGGSFSEEFVEGERRNLKDYIAGQKNDKINYSIIRAIEEMCHDEPYSLSEFGQEADVDTISAKDLYTHYEKLLKEAQIEIFYIGNEIEKDIIAGFSAFGDLKNRKPADIPDARIFKDAKEIKEVIEKMDVAQGKLCIGYRTGITQNDEIYPALVMANEIFGATPVSKLFTNVREKLSLCYFVRSRHDKLKGVMLVIAGIENCNLKLTIDEIDAQLSAMQQGDITGHELESARASIKTTIDSILDSQYLMEDYYMTGLLSGNVYDPGELISKLEAVSLEEIKSAAERIKKDTVYFLWGTDGAEVSA